MTAFYVFLLLVRVATGVISPIAPMQCDVVADYGATFGVDYLWDLIYTQDGLWLLELDTAYNVTVVCDGWAPAYIELAGGYQWVVLEPAALPLDP